MCIGWSWGCLPFLLVGVGGFWNWVGVRLVVKKILRKYVLDYDKVVDRHAVICFSSRFWIKFAIVLYQCSRCLEQRTVRWY